MTVYLLVGRNGVSGDRWNAGVFSSADNAAEYAATLRAYRRDQFGRGRVAMEEYHVMEMPLDPGGVPEATYREVMQLA